MAGLASFLRVALLASLTTVASSVATNDTSVHVTEGSLYSVSNSQPTGPLSHGQEVFNGPATGYDSPSRAHAVLDPLQDIRAALDVSQTIWYEVWVGKWPTSIDWTGAVLNTHIVASLSTLSKALARVEGETSAFNFHVRNIENDINTYFSQTAAYYFGEDAFAIRQQAYDDMLWVVLDWLESIKFVELHSSLHYINVQETTKPWHGTQFIEAFAHRARVFYDIAKQGWDTKYCGGGLTWNPYLGPYKNAITNQLFISASIAMYLYFPGDSNTAPFLTFNDGKAYPHDPHYLQAAVDGYDWLKNSRMTNAKGLYTDGFHVSNWTRNGTTCDQRNEMVFTYNQGVVLSGLRGLWEATSNISYLEDGHELVRNTVAATGWLVNSANPSKSSEWHGLGRNGVLEDICDHSGQCDQNGHTFKGIYFHHLTLFCEKLPLEPLVPGKTYTASRELAFLHHQSCQEYALWVAHNARAAVGTRDQNGKFGSWWNAGMGLYESVSMPEGAVDYRNNVSELEKALWSPNPDSDSLDADAQYRIPGPLHAASQSTPKPGGSDVAAPSGPPKDPATRDLNDRGRGRTVESHSGGIAVLRSLLELLDQAH